MKSVLFHVVLWHGKDGPSLTGYDSRDPNVIGDQLSAMATLASAIEAPSFGVILLTYGPTNSAFIHIACMEMARQCNSRRIPFALCYDPYVVKDLSTGKILLSPAKENAMIAALRHSDTQWMLNSRMYLPGKPVLDFLDASQCANPKMVLAAVPGIQYWVNGTDFSWIRFRNDSTLDANAYRTENTRGLPCAFPSFNDGTGKDRNKQAWAQTLPARIASPMAGGLWWDMVHASDSNPSKWIQVVWNDVRENGEGGPEAFAAMLWGRIGK